MRLNWYMVYNSIVAADNFLGFSTNIETIIKSLLLALKTQNFVHHYVKIFLIYLTEYFQLCLIYTYRLLCHACFHYGITVIYNNQFFHLQQIRKLAEILVSKVDNIGTLSQ